MTRVSQRRLIFSFNYCRLKEKERKNDLEKQYLTLLNVNPFVSRSVLYTKINIELKYDPERIDNRSCLKYSIKITTFMLNNMLNMLMNMLNMLKNMLTSVSLAINGYGSS